MKLLSITPDALIGVWVRDGALMIGNRSATTTDFAEQPLSLPSGYDPTQGVALSPDGLRLIIVRQDNLGFAQVVRDSAGAAFSGTPAESPFQILNRLPPINGFLYGSPILAPNGKRLYFSEWSPTDAMVYCADLSDNGDWGGGTLVGEDSLRGKPTARLLPTGISADELTLFFFDEGKGEAGAAWRDTPVAPFYTRRSLGARSGAVPDMSCEYLYSSAGPRLVVERQAP